MDYRLAEIYESPFRIDEISNNLTYVGFINDQNVNESSPIWRIKRISITGTVTKIEYPDGDTSFSKIWNDRSTLNYK